MSSISAYMQSGTVSGKFVAIASGTLTDKEGYFVKPTGSMVGSYMEVAISSASTDTPVYLLNAGAAAAKPVEIIALDPDTQQRAIISGTCTVGGVLTLASDGRIKAYASASDTVVGTAEEDGVDGQWVKFRPYKLGASTAVAVQTNGTKVAAGSSQTDATAITATVTYVTGADGATGVKLPSAVAGAHYVVYNKDANVLLLYPGTSDSINNQSANAAIKVPGWSVAICDATDTTVWAVAIASEFNNASRSVVAITGAGTLTSDAQAITEQPGCVLSASGASNSGIKLPASLAGAEYTVFVTGANTIKVWPPASGTINGGSADAAVSVATKTRTILTCLDGTDWSANEIPAA